VSIQLPPVDDEVYAALQARAVPLEDDVNSVLRRLLGLTPTGTSSATAEAAAVSLAPERPAGRPRRHAGPAKKSTKKRTRVPKGSILPEDEYELPILRALEHLGGRVPTSEVVAQVEKEIGARLTDVDREELSSGGVRWQNRVQFVRLKLIKKGEMVEGSPRGIWEISPAGRDRISRAS
jgi:hypothetical protein